MKTTERIDELQRNGYRIIQDPDRFCFGMDAVLLSDFAQAGEGDKVLDLGTGTGIIPILMEAKNKGASFWGLEIQEESADMARRSVILNGLEEKISIIQGDIKETKGYFSAGFFDVVTCNPPYMAGNHGLVNLKSAKTIARHEVLCTFTDIVSQTAKVIKPGGRFYLVHRPFRLAEIIHTLMTYGLEPKRLRFVHPYVDREPNMVLLEAVRGGKSRIQVEKPLIVFAEKGKYTDAIREIYGYD